MPEHKLLWNPGEGHTKTILKVDSGAWTILIEQFILGNYYGYILDQNENVVWTGRSEKVEDLKLNINDICLVLNNSKTLTIDQQTQLESIKQRVKRINAGTFDPEERSIGRLFADVEFLLSLIDN